MLRANDDRRRNAHVVVFFIFLVSNIGGSLTPLGDPPLFLGFLRGVDFFWTTTHLFPETLFVAGLLLGAVLPPRHGHLPQGGARRPTRRRTRRSALRGLVNLALIGVIIAAILMSAAWKLGSELHHPRRRRSNSQTALRDLMMVLVTFVSLALTPKASTGRRTGFPGGRSRKSRSSSPASFITHDPGARHAARRTRRRLRAACRAGHATRTARRTTPPISGSPAGCRPSSTTRRPIWSSSNWPAAIRKHLMTAGASTLAAISAGAVFMGANTYIGNAPNFMVYAIAEKRRGQDAGLLRLHAVVGRGADPGVHPGDVGVLPLRGAPADGAAYGLG